jgi:branched-chain amino acid transport system permease protein
VIAGAMYWVIHKTRIGMMIRAGNSNREMAASLGINMPLLFAWVFAFGVALAALAGAIASPISSVFPGMGHHILILCFVVVVIGGIGSINGAMIASLAIGLADTLGKVIAAEYSAIAVYLVMALILLWRPQGIANKA